MVKTKSKSFLFLFVAFVFMLFLSCVSKVNAEFYDQSKNKIVEDSIHLDRSKGIIKFNVEYQNGIKDLKVYICEDSNNCSDGHNKTKYVASDLTTPRINPANKATVYEFVVNNDTPDHGEALTEYTDEHGPDGKPNNIYYMKVVATFCVARGASEANPTQQECKTWDTSPGFYTWGKEVDLDNGGITGDSKINATLARILNIVNTIVIPILWAVLAVILVVRGIMLGMDIVKSADEAEVRKKKIQGLIWLFIGVGVGYAVTIIANIVIGMFGFGGIF